MRLVDRVAQEPIAPRLRSAALPAPRAALLDLVADAGLRYILDEAASAACGTLLRAESDLFDLSSPLLRLPAELFWIELFLEEDETRAAGAAPARLGMLVDAEPDGRRGTIHHVWEDAVTGFQLVPAHIRFDLDAPPRPVPGRSYSLRHAALPHISALLAHAVMEVHEPAPPQSPLPSREYLAESLWFGLPAVLAFAALLNSPEIVETRGSDLSRLNAARLKRGRPPLLDHVEVRLNLGEAARSDGQIGGVRSPPRLHFVRGHLVRRKGKTFWRSSHLRGDGPNPIVQKTISVTARRR